MVTLISLDTNIFLNVKNKEEPFFEDSLMVLDLIDENKVMCVLSTIVLAEMCAGYYENKIEEINEVKVISAEELCEALRI